MLAAVLIVLAAGGMEAFWRAQGHVPSISDSLGLWAQQRALIDNAYPDNSETTVLIGDSRMQLDFNTRTFHELYPGKPLVNLAIDGTSPGAVLRDLAADENFKGLVIASADTWRFGRDQWETTQNYVDYYHKNYKANIDRQLNVEITAFLQQHLALLQQNLSLKQLLKTGVKGEWPAPFYLSVLSDRSRLADYSKMPDLTEHRAERIRREKAVNDAKPPHSAEELRADLETVRGWVAAIQGRSGDVVFIRFPTEGELWAMDEARYPRGIFWPMLGDMTDAKAIHFMDVPEMQGFKLPDASHMDGKDTDAFTRALLNAVTRAGLLPQD